MGCDIHAFAEVRRDGQWETVGAVFPLDKFGAKWEKRTHTEEPFGWRNYGMFGFLAGVRNDSAVEPLSAPKGLPPDISPKVREAAEYWEADGHSHSWLSLRELDSVDYEGPVENRRYTRQVGPNSFDGGATAPAGAGVLEKRADFLGEHFMRHLEVLRTLGAPDDVRVVFWFDN